MAQVVPPDPPKPPRKPYNPREGCKVHIEVDLQDLCHKAAKFGALHVIGETLLNICLMENDRQTGGRTAGRAKKG